MKAIKDNASLYRNMGSYLQHIVEFKKYIKYMQFVYAFL